MSKKLFVLISTLTGCVATAASALVAYFSPAHAGAIVSAIGIAEVAIVDILQLFVDPDKATKKAK